MLLFLSSSLCFSNLTQGSLGNCTVKVIGETKAAKRHPTVNRTLATAGCRKEPPFRKGTGLVRYPVSRAETDTQAPAI